MDVLTLEIVILYKIKVLIAYLCCRCKVHLLRTNAVYLDGCQYSICTDPAHNTSVLSSLGLGLNSDVNVAH